MVKPLCRRGGRLSRRGGTRYRDSMNLGGESARNDVFCAVLWAAVIFGTIRYAQPLMQFLGEHLGHDAGLNKIFTAVIFAALTGLCVRLVRRPGFNAARGAWTALVVAGYGYAMYAVELPIEKLHFLEYGILAVFVFRAARHALPRVCAYAVVVPVCYVVGVLDEYLQSFMPRRVGEISDTFINLAAAILATIELVFAWIPAGIDQPIQKRHIWWVFAAWTAALLAGAGFIHLVSDFGYRLTDPSIGTFRSSFSREDMARYDRERGAEAAAIIDASDDTAYPNFLITHSRKTDPYIHECRVRLFRRDRYLRKARSDDPDATTGERLEFLRVAVMENRILESYYPTLMARSNRLWGDIKSEMERELSAKNALAPTYISPVGGQLITAFRLKELWAGIALADILLLIWVARRR